ncbi:MAG: ion channel [Bryobacteraceae bacterium]|nr:ion channel [Bryobacteraceae bacterium]
MELEGEIRLPKPDESNDLGIGAKVAEQSGVRLLNQDGTFNVQRQGLGLLRSLSIYHHLLSMRWTGFFALIVSAYVLTNLLFAFGYLLCGPEGLEGTTATTPGGRFLEAYFFSVQTLATIGYGKMNPANLGAHILVSIEALVGLLGFALATGLLFSRFSRPTADILFSRNAIIAPFRGGRALEFRIVNSRSNHLTAVEATVVAAMGRLGTKGRQFYELNLERNQVMFLPLHWVVVHPIDESSPLYGLTASQFEERDIEFLILIKAVDETFAQTVHVRSSYTHHEVLWHRKFRDMFVSPNNGNARIDVRRLSETEPA